MMPKLLVVHLPTDEIHDEITIDEDELGETVEELYESWIRSTLLKSARTKRHPTNKLHEHG